MGEGLDAPSNPGVDLNEHAWRGGRDVVLASAVFGGGTSREPPRGPAASAGWPFVTPGPLVRNGPLRPIEARCL